MSESTERRSFDREVLRQLEELYARNEENAVEIKSHKDECGDLHRQNTKSHEQNTKTLNKISGRIEKLDLALFGSEDDNINGVIPSLVNDVKELKCQKMTLYKWVLGVLLAALISVAGAYWAEVLSDIKQTTGAKP